MAPTLNEEKKLWRKGFRYIAGIDEVGRGPLAGPVVACAVCLNSKLGLAKENLIRLRFPGLKDSKQLSLKRREQICALAQKHPAIRWGIGIVSEKVIDKINIFQATKAAMQKAVAALQKKTAVDFLIIDGNFSLPVSLAQKSIVKGDEKVFSCALASILAKVTRDALMQKYHTLYPNYGFHKHKGYGTPLHLAMLKKYGSCSLHRKSFQPVAAALRI